MVREDSQVHICRRRLLPGDTATRIAFEADHKDAADALCNYKYVALERRDNL